MIVAYFVSHNEGNEHGIIANAGDAVHVGELYEAEVSIGTFDTAGEAQAWIDRHLAILGDEGDDDDDDVMVDVDRGDGTIGAGEVTFPRATRPGITDAEIDEFAEVLAQLEDRFERLPANDAIRQRVGIEIHSKLRHIFKDIHEREQHGIDMEPERSRVRRLTNKVLVDVFGLKPLDGNELSRALGVDE